MAFIRNTDKFIEGSKLFFSNERAKAAVQSDLDQLASEDSAIKLRLDTIEGSGEGSIAKAKLDAQAYADQQVAALVNSAPSVLDTLKELADALNNDASFASTVAGQIGAVDVKVDEEIERATAAEALLDGRMYTAEQELISLREYADELNNDYGNLINSHRVRLEALEADPVTKSYVDLLDAQKIEAIEQLDNTLIGLQEQVSQEVTNRQDADTALDYRVTALEAFPGSSESVADTLVKRNSAGAADISEMYMYTPTAGPNAEQYSFLNELEIGVFNDAEGKSAKLQKDQVRVSSDGKISQLFAGKLSLTEGGSPVMPEAPEDVTVKAYVDLLRDEAENYLNSEIQLLVNTDVSLQNQITQEVSDRISETSTLGEEVAALWEQTNSAATRLNVLESDPVTKTYVDGQVSGLQGQIDTEKGRIDAILSASEADKDSFAEIVQLINSVDTSNDQAFASYVLSNDAALAQEVSDRQSAISSVEGMISAEESRAISAESALSGRLDALESDPTTKSYVDGIQSALDARIDSLELDSVTKAYVDSSKLSDNVQSISASTSVSSSSQTQIFFCSVSGGSVTITLPSASSVAVGRKFGVKDTGSSSPSGNFITVAAQAGQTVDGQASFEMKVPFEAAQFVSDGSQWFVM